VTDDLIRWCEDEGRRVDGALEVLADRRLALGELGRSALNQADVQGTIGCTPEALEAAHASDPAAAAALRTLFDRAIDPDSEPDDDDDAASTYDIEVLTNEGTRP
jgi:hypothetical protein